ncbi:MAG: fumarylacetoacetate hydrolase family protein [Gammaproteobacteria bacterium]
MAYVINNQGPTTLEVTGSRDSFPVRRIYCVGRNYAEHAREMGHDPGAEPPFFFQKPADALVANDARFPYPPLSEDVQYEMELVVAMGRGGRDIPADHALERVYGYAVGLDMTRRDLQQQAKKLGRPWEVGKAFDYSAPCSAIHTVADMGGHPDKGSIWLKVNGKTKQDSDISHMIWNTPQIIAHLSKLFNLAPGDLIFTGTPAGVGRIKRGDEIHGGVDGVDEIRITVI